MRPRSVTLGPLLAEPEASNGRAEGEAPWSEAAAAAACSLWRGLGLQQGCYAQEEVAVPSDPLPGGARLRSVSSIRLRLPCAESELNTPRQPLRLYLNYQNQ